MKMKSGHRTILETRYDRGDNRFPVKIAITFIHIDNGEKKWAQKYYPTGYHLTKSEFERIMNSGRLDGELKEVREGIKEMEAKTNEILKGNPTPEQFKTIFTSVGGLHRVIDHFDRYAQQCEDEGRISSRDSYNNASASFIAFSSKLITFAEINVAWLKKYERWGLNRGMSINTIGIYLRNLRAIFNQVMKDPYNLVPKENYPFGKSGYKIKRKRGGKRAPSGAEISQLLKMTNLEGKARKARAFWMFSYFGYGMNPADIAMLRIKHLQHGEIQLDRTKTLNTEHESRTILIPIHPEMQEVIKEYGNKSLNKNEYVFPILESGLSAAQIKSRIHDFRAYVNDGLRLLKFDNPMKFGEARHGFATTLMRKGVTTEFIQNALGHSDPTVTQHYLDGFDTDTRKRMSDLLTG